MGPMGPVGPMGPMTPMGPIGSGPIMGPMGLIGPWARVPGFSHIQFDLRISLVFVPKPEAPI